MPDDLDQLISEITTLTAAIERHRRAMSDLGHRRADAVRQAAALSSRKELAGRLGLSYSAVTRIATKAG